MRPLLIRSTALFALAFTLICGAPLAAAAATGTDLVDPDGRVVTATYEGQSIDPQLASHYFCHTRDYPIVRCFASQEEVDNDLGIVEPTAPGEAGMTQSSAGESVGGVTPDFPPGVAYTIAYWDINYGGNALTIYGAISNLNILGWGDNISSIKSVNCGIPRYYVDASYSGPYWQNGCDYWSASLGSYNDTFSSVLNEAP